MQKQKVIKPILEVKNQGQVKARKEELEKTGMDPSSAESQARGEVETKAESEANSTMMNPQESVNVSFGPTVSEDSDSKTPGKLAIGEMSTSQNDYVDLSRDARKKLNQDASKTNESRKVA